MNICFITSLFADSYENADKPEIFEKMDDCDYFLFTNLPKENFETSWEIIEIDYMFDNTDITSNIIKSRYPKFMGWHILNKITEKKYDIVFYCDAIKYPIKSNIWDEYSKEILKNEFGLLQQCHQRNAYEELKIVCCNYKKDTKSRCGKTKEFFLENNFPSKQLMTENDIFGYDPNNQKITDIFTEFWSIYKNYTLSHRDQPLWSFLLWKNNIKPKLLKKHGLRPHFRGIKSVGFKNHNNYK
tara:strand:+ start:15308 stop:16033 length:726 start_codon:yes stop_codon:yes gene_type:complete